MRQPIRDLIGAKQSGFMPENGGLQCSNVRIPDSLSVRESEFASRPVVEQRAVLQDIPAD